MDVVAWLRALGLERYAQAFSDSEVTADILTDLTDADLRELGLPLGPRKILLKAIASLRPSSVQESHSTTQAAPGPHDGSGSIPRIPASRVERRQLTVMFIDLVGSTALSTRLDPEDLRDVIAAYHRCVADIIGRHGGFVAKYMGDGVLVYFGYPQAHEDDAERALRAGLALVDAVPHLRTSDQHHVRIGVATGLVVVGDLIGEGEAQEYGVVGETPNLAARLQSLAEADTMVIAASTRRLTGRLFQYQDLGALDMKGLAEPVQVWRVLGSSGIASRFEALRGDPSTPLIGRDEEMELLRRRWEQVKEGEGRVVLLSGEAGIGKSRLLQSLQDHLRGQPHTLLRYFCAPHHQDSPLYPIVAQLEQAAGFEPEEDPATKVGKLEKLLLPGAKDCAIAVPLMADLLSVPVGGRYAPLSLNPEKRKEHTLACLGDRLTFLATQRAVLMLFEDAHWCDPSSLELLDLVIDRIVDRPVLLVVTFRPEFRAPWADRAHVSHVALGRLTSRQGKALIERITGGKSLPPDLLTQIVTRTDGVPLFIEEVTSTVLGSVLLHDRGDRFEISGELVPLVVPASLHDALVERLDRMGTARDIAQMGAVVGREFSYEMIHAVAGLPDERLQAALDQLVNGEVLTRRGVPPQATYSFRHALLQDASYGALLRGRRQQLHATIAHTLRERSADDSRPEIVAHHLTEAGLFDEAIGFWVQAGHRAASQSAAREAINHYRKSLGLLETLPTSEANDLRELTLLIALGPVLMTVLSSASPEVQQVYVRARELAARSGRSSELFKAVWGAWLIASVEGQTAGARRLVKELRRLADGQNDPEMRLQAAHAGFTTEVFHGDLAKAAELAREARGLYDRDAHRHHALVYGGHDPGVCAFGNGATAHLLLGHVDQARTLVKNAVTLAREIDHVPSLAHALRTEGDLRYLLRDIAGVERSGAAILALPEEHVTVVTRANARMLQGWAWVAAGRIAEGINELESGLAAWRTTQSRFHATCRLGRAADALIAGGRFDEASALLDEALARVENGGERWTLPEVLRLMGVVRIAAGRSRVEAEDMLQRAIASAREAKSRWLELRTATSLAGLWRDQDKRAQARNLLAPVYCGFTEGFDTPDLKEAKALLDVL
jgi:class 3 adenylate cyclase/predicted ATPase